MSERRYMSERKRDFTKYPSSAEDIAAGSRKAGEQQHEKELAARRARIAELRKPYEAKVKRAAELGRNAYGSHAGGGIGV